MSEQSIFDEFKDDDELSEKESLMKKHLEGGLSDDNKKSKHDSTKDDILNKIRNTVQSEQFKKENTDEYQSDKRLFKDINYISVDLSLLPTEGKFYPKDMILKIRSAESSEIKTYSSMDENAPAHELMERIDEIIISCTKVYYSNKLGSWKIIKTNDKIDLLFLIRDLTMKNKTKLESPYKCPHCSHTGKVEICRDNMMFYTPDEDEVDDDEKIMQYYSEDDRCFIIPTVEDEIIKIAPTSLGVQKTFVDYVTKKALNKEILAKNFMNIMPYLTGNNHQITESDVKKLELEYLKMSEEKFEFLDKFVNKLSKSFGLKSTLKFECDGCGEEVVSDMNIPSGFRGLFFVQSKLGQFVRK